MSVADALVTENSDLRYELKLSRETNALLVTDIVDLRSQLTAHQAGNARLLDEQKADAATIKLLRAENDRLIAEIVLLTRVEANIRRFVTSRSTYPINHIDGMRCAVADRKQKRVHHS